MRTGERAKVERRGKPLTTHRLSFACPHHITVQRGSLKDIRMMTSLLSTILSAKSRPSLSASSPFYFDKVARNASSVHLSASTITRGLSSPAGRNNVGYSVRDTLPDFLMSFLGVGGHW
ncbi:hypothetical protein BT69DRAFT_1280862 [Atractiella rhizophila]|nr:hypothetical protein BT69DRAFT_1280862 [Atractiella rhizophila]